MTTVTQTTGQFSGYTLDELRALVLKKLRVTNTVRYSPTAGTADYDWIDDALNRAQDDFVKRTLCLRTYVLIELKANYRTYRLPWNFLDFMAAYYYDDSFENGYKELIVTTIEKLNDEFSDWRTAVGKPTHIYIDRVYGSNWMLGLYPIPESDGDSITFDSDYGAVVEWVCPYYKFNQEYGVVLRMTGTDEYFLNTDAGVVGKVETMNKNIWIEFYRLPEKLLDVATNLGDMGVQYPDISREYQISLVDAAVSELLESNPEDSAEFKRSMALKAKPEAEIKKYIDKRKRPLAGLNLRAMPAVWGWMKNMDFYNKLP